MSKILKLTKNEILKQFKKKSVLIMTSVILAGAFLAPLAIKFTDNTPDYSESIGIGISSLEGNIDSLNEKKPKDRVIKLYTVATKETQLLMSKYNKSELFWLKNEGNNYESYLILSNVIDLIKEGIDQKTISDNIMNVDVTELEKIFNADKSEYDNLKSSYEKKANESKRIIEEKDYYAYAKSQVAFFNGLISDSKESLKTIDKNDTKEISRINSNIEELEAKVEIFQYRIDNKIPEENNSWKSDLLEQVLEDKLEIIRPILTESEYINNPMNAMEYKMTYPEYKEFATKNKETLKENVEINLYAVKNNIQSLGYNDDARTGVNKLYNIFIIISMVIAIIIGGGIVANEFSKGTIRLLLVRPISRGKVLTSKLLAVLTIGLGLAIATTTIATISSGIFLGFSTLGIPVLSFANGAVVETNYFLYMLPSFLISCSSLIFIVALTFMLSTVVKNGVVAVIIPTILLFGSNLLTNVLMTSDQMWVKSTFIPYINIPMMEIMNSHSSSIGLQQDVFRMNYTLGVAWMIGLAVICIVASFISFTKSDIKN